MPHLAGVIAANNVNGEWHLTVDGVEFPYQIASAIAGGELSAKGYPVLTVSILAGQIEIVHTVPTPAPAPTKVKPGVYEQDTVKRRRHE